MPIHESQNDPQYGQIQRPILQFKILDPRASVPAYQSSGAAGLDLAVCFPADGPQERVLQPGEIFLAPTGLAVAIAPGFEGQVRPRSGLSVKFGIGVPNSPGTIDSDYRGELKVALINLSQQPYTLTHGTRMAQLVIAPVAMAQVVVVSELDSTVRGSGGFGSTGFEAPAGAIAESKPQPQSKTV